MKLEKNIELLKERYDYNKKVGIKTTTFEFKTKDIGDLLHQLEELVTLRELYNDLKKENLETISRCNDLWIKSQGRN
ncbi:MAG: hypothetical protein MJ126_05720 [Lachnospiraceae bacterium]|nr:hypothetical protein [Lachnospiraceae bacterium]